MRPSRRWSEAARVLEKRTSCEKEMLRPVAASMKAAAVSGVEEVERREKT